ncbi:MAG: phosphate ABC transporter substrate-binding/OmpA family protein [Acidobacteriota bacterium]|nr:phosphate ABC transporter substrate-binding/OmpA family protein [Acidobacteriota bacterium]
MKISTPRPRLAQILLWVFLPIFLPAAAAYGQSTDPEGATVLQVKGSDTIGGALGPALARAYEGTHPGAEIHWGSLGSGTAFVGLFDGSADLGASSRSVKESELAEARRLGLELKEYILGYDGIAVLVHPDNPVAKLSIGQLSRLFTGQITSWSELGGPDLPVVLISRPSYSGTHGFFKEKVVRRGNKKGPEEFGPQTRFVEHSEDIVKLVAGEPGAISYLGMGWVRPEVRAVPVVGRNGRGFLPTLETVRAGTYPVYRPLLLYTRGEPTGELRRLLAFLLAGDGQRLVAEHDFIPADVPSTVSRSVEPQAKDASAAEASRIQLHRILFPFGGTTLDTDARATLDRIAQRLREGGLRAEIVGHGDADGSALANRRVSNARALAVANYLRRQGVSPKTLRVEGRGATQPVATNDTAEGRRLNRRVDVRLLPAG